MSKTLVSTERQAKKAKLAGLKHTMNGQSLLGNVVTFDTKSEKPRKHKDLVDALTDADLDPKFARELLPKSAFTRACKKLSENAVIDTVKEGEDYIRFQFTKKAMKNEEWVYSKDTELSLNKTTGEITCKKQDLKDAAQRLVDQALEDRGTSDVTLIVNRLCDKNTDLFFIKAGVYFVPQEKADFLIKIDNFLTKIGGEVNQFPVPAGTKLGDKAVKNSVAEALQAMIEEHNQAIDNFSVSTRKDTMENAASKIKETRVKIEAYAHLLKEKQEVLLKAVETAKEKLRKQIEHLSKEKESLPDEPQTLMGHSISSILKWMGSNDWKYLEAKKVMESKGFHIADTTIRGQLWCGKTERYGKAAVLDSKAEKELNKIRKE